MYADHVPTINAAMRADADVFARGITFAILSMRQQITSLPDQMAEIEQHGDASVCLFGFKRAAYRYVMDHKVQLWQDVCAADDTASAIRILCTIPGMGIIKSAFVLQMVGFDVSCLDSRNMAKQGRSTEEYHTRKTSPRFLTNVLRYVAETAGKAQVMWDSWCVETADVYGWTAEAISKLHLTTIVPVAYTGLQTMVVPFIGTPEAIPF